MGQQRPEFGGRGRGVAMEQGGDLLGAEPAPALIDVAAAARRPAERPLGGFARSRIRRAAGRTVRRSARGNGPRSPTRRPRRRCQRVWRR